MKTSTPHIAKARVSEWEHQKTKTKLGLYVNGHTGEWYAFVPDTQHGELVRGSTREALIRELRVVADRVLCLEWRGVIRIRLAPPTRLVAVSHRTSRLRDERMSWDPMDPATAGDEILIDFEAVEIATDNQGVRWYREWLTPNLPPDWHRHLREDRWERIPGVAEELPYTPENMAALERFRDLVTGLNHQIRTFCASENFAARLLAAGAGLRLLATSSDR